MVFTILPMRALAEDINANETETGYGSNGKFIAPIETPVAGSIPISNRGELEAIANDLNANYHLTQDIDLSGKEWTPIGDNCTDSDASRFTGTFDGQGHVISNLTITGGYKYAGLFGYASGAVIKNVGLEDTSINVIQSPSQPEVAYVGGICGRSTAFVSNCYNTGSISSSTELYYDAFAGGICGYSTYNSSCSISNCFNTAAISSASSSSWSFAYAGGICGVSSCSISNCYNTGGISSSSSSSSYAYAGGICGFAELADSFGSYNINDCYNTGVILSSTSSYYSAYSGGICGASADSASISNCCNTGAIFSSSLLSSSRVAYAGGICGLSASFVSHCYNTGAISSFSSSDSYSAIAGGICGASDSFYGTGIIGNCYNAGVILSSSSLYKAYAGGICGACYNFIINCYNTSSISSSASSSSYTGGICGFASAALDSCSINSCYNTGDISSSSSLDEVNAGGICGHYADSYYAYFTIINSYWRL